MELILNELSVQDLTGTPDDARQKMNELLLLCKKAKDEVGCNGLRLPNADFFSVELVEGYSLSMWMTEQTGNRTLQTLFNGLRRYPYFEDMEDELQDEYILSKFSLNESQHPSHRAEITGLANAWLIKTLAVSFCSHPVWNKPKIGLSVQKEENLQNVEVYHACTTSCIDDEFKAWFRKEHLPPLLTHEDVDKWFPIGQYSLTEQVKNDLISIYNQNLHKHIDEIERLIKEIWLDPMAGTGKPKTLQGDFAGWMSRRITDKHRLVYKLNRDVLEICRCYGHYDDK